MRLGRAIAAPLVCAIFATQIGFQSSVDASPKIDQSKVTFHAVGPGGLKIQGATTDLNIHEDERSFTVVVPLKNLTTGIELRDRHMKEKYLEIDKYPNAILVVDKTLVRLPKPGEHFKHNAAGTLEIHGVKKPVNVGYEIENMNQGILVVGSFPVNMKDHSIEVPGYLGVTVKPDVTVAATFRLER